MRLSRLQEQLAGAGRAGPDGDPDVTHLALDSRRAGAGSCFFAAAGARADGLRFLDDAVARGAVAAVVENSEADVDWPVPVLTVTEVRDALGRAASALHRDLLDQLVLLGVTGTKGKTTTALMTAAVLEAAGVHAASVGTLGVRDRQGRFTLTGNTTPDAARLMEILVELHASGHQAVVLEASSQAAVQARVRYLPFRGMAFLNLSPEHGELHPTLEEYRAAKARLFADAAPLRQDFTAVLPTGDPDAEAMAEAVGGERRVVRYCDRGGPRPEARVEGSLVEAGLTHLDLRLRLGEEEAAVRLPLGGRFNLQNACAAVALAQLAGADLEAARRGLEALPTVPGRFQVLSHQGVTAMVDYAHSANALEALLESCRQVSGQGRILLVFGCGGEKDPDKRPRMGSSAACHADQVWVTNDNPRREDPAAIAAQVTAGIPPDSRAEVRVELDRRAAIRRALEEARPGDLVVVAGKGHEATQTIGETELPFDDLIEIRRCWGLDPGA